MDKVFITINRYLIDPLFSLLLDFDFIKGFTTDFANRRWTFY